MFSFCGWHILNFHYWTVVLQSCAIISLDQDLKSCQDRKLRVESSTVGIVQVFSDAGPPFSCLVPTNDLIESLTESCSLHELECFFCSSTGCFWEGKCFISSNIWRSQGEFHLCILYRKPLSVEHTVLTFINAVHCQIQITLFLIFTPTAT